MYDYLKGTLADKRKTAKGYFFVVEVSGVGYLLEVSERDFLECGNDIQKFYTALIHREDNMMLYGFLNKESRDIFQILISVSGVGAKMAIALLNEFNICELISFVIDGDFKELTRAIGVGPKLAQQIILELKDKLIQTDFQRTKCSLPQSQAILDAQSIMLSLGYEDKEIDLALSNILSTIEDTNNSEEILRKALISLSG